MYNIDNILLVNSSYAFFYKFVMDQCRGIFKNFLNQIKFLNIIKNGFHEIIIKNQPYEHEMFNKYEIYKKNKLENIYQIKS